MLRPAPSITLSTVQGAQSQDRARDALIKEMMRRRSEIDSHCPVHVRRANDCADSMCAVCLEGVVSGDLQRTLRCGHTFHSSCVELWLMYGAAAPSCPVCKQTLACKKTLRVDHTLLDAELEETDDRLEESLTAALV